MKKILLIQPKSPETFWKLTGSLKILHKNCLVPPLGVSTVAALTPPTYEVKIIDEEVDSIDFDVDCDLVGISGYTVHSNRMFEIASEFRKRGVLTVGGGPFCTSHSDDCAPHFDVLVCGEVEHVWSQFLADWERGDFQKRYQGAEDIDLAATPIPRWDLLKTDEYCVGMVQTSRGCPYDCEFCDVISLFGNRMRYKPLEKISEELAIVAQKGFQEVFIADDNLIGNKGFVTSLLNLIIDFNARQKIPIKFITQVTLNIAKDEDLLDLFMKANFHMLFIGIETPKEESLVHTNKEHNLKLGMKEAVRRIQSRGIFIVCGMIVGFDTDDLKIFDAQRKFLLEAGLAIPMLGILTAFKSTKLWDRLEKENRLLPMDTGDNQAKTNIVPKQMTGQELEENYLKLVHDVYHPEHFFKCLEANLNQVKMDLVKKDSYLEKLLQPRNLTLYNVGVTLRLFAHYIFNKNREKRALFWSAAKILQKKGTLCLPLLISQFLFFTAGNHFLEQHKLNYFEQ
jgi:radical SAM superfamily enzyme YgiQ (UPF0313 family)